MAHTSRMVSPVWTSAFHFPGGEIGRALLNARPFGATVDFLVECLLCNRSFDARIDSGGVHGPVALELPRQGAHDVCRRLGPGKQLRGIRAGGKPGNEVGAQR
jgi:hypothetical protein